MQRGNTRTRPNRALERPVQAAPPTAPSPSTSKVLTYAPIVIGFVSVAGVLWGLYETHKLNASTIAAADVTTRHAEAEIKALRSEVDQIPQKLAERQAALDQARASTALAKGQLASINDPIARASERAALERLNLERDIADDGVMVAMLPSVSFQSGGDVLWRDHSIEIPQMWTNSGKRPLHARVSVEVTISSSVMAPVPTKGEWSVDVCSAGLVAPGEPMTCSITLKSAKSLANVDRISAEYVVLAETYTKAGGPVIDRLRKRYGSGELEKLLSRDFTRVVTVER